MSLTQQEAHTLEDLNIIVHFEGLVELENVFGPETRELD